MKTGRNIDKCHNREALILSEGKILLNNEYSYRQGMKKWKIHVRIVFCLMFQIKQKKVDNYLLTNYIFVYLCGISNSVT